MGITKSSHLIALGAFDASSGSGGSASAVTLLSITTEPSAPFAKGSKYFNSTDNKIYTAIADDVWGIKGEDPSFVAYYVYNGETYTWDGNSMEPFELENYQKVSNLKTTIEASTTSDNFYPSTSAVANFVFDQGIAHNFSEVKIPNTDPQETLNDYTSSSYTFLDLAQKIQLCQLTMGTILYGEVRNQGMPTGIGNAELRVEVLETKGNGKQVLLFTLFSTNVAPNMWTYIYFQGQTDDAVVWTPRAISTNDYTSTSTGTVPTSKALSDGLATKQNTLTAGTGIDITNDVISVTDILPAQTGNKGKVLTTDGSSISWDSAAKFVAGTSQNNIEFGQGSSGLDWSNLQVGDRLDNKATYVGMFPETVAEGEQQYAVFVLDAQYRTARAHGSYSGLTQYSDYSDAANYVLNAKDTAKDNTETLVANSADGALAAYQAGSVVVNGTTYYSYLPNAYELMLIYNNKDLTSIGLSDWGASLTQYTRALSSNAGAYDNPFIITSEGIVSRQGPNDPLPIFPVFEIPVPQPEVRYTNVTRIKVDGVLYQIQDKSQFTINDNISTTPSITVVNDTYYTFSNALTSLTLSSVANINNVDILFTTASGFSGVTFVSGTLYTGTIPTWEAGKTYLISIQKGIVVAAEIKAME